MRTLAATTIFFCVLAIAFEPDTSAAQSITIQSFPGTSFCAGDSVYVVFTATGSWGSGNAFMLQLSDSTGSFSNGFQNLGSLIEDAAGTFRIDGTISGIASTHYRIRILAANPPIASADNGTDITIGNRPGYFNFLNFLPGAAIGTTMTFTAVGDLDNSAEALDAAFWDFGPGATPATATTKAIGGNDISFSQSVTYGTPGDKTVTLTIIKPGGCSGTTLTNSFHVYDCSAPSIPHDAIVVNSNGVVASANKSYWINPGFIFGFGEGDTVFAEPGSTITGNSGNCVLYMKAGSILNSKNGGPNSVIAGSGASITANVNLNSIFTCPALDFDYTSAPPNVFHPTASVQNDLNPASITVSPNPTGGMLSVQGLPSGNTTVSVFNTLGETVMVEKNPRAHDFTLDLSKLVPGSYYVRFSSANSVVTKKIIKD